MSKTTGKLLEKVLGEVFGESVALVAAKLHHWNGQTFQQLLLPPRIPRSRDALVVLIQRNLVSFSECPRSGRMIYTLKEDRALSLVKYPRFLVLCKTLFGDEGELIVEEVFKTGQESASMVLFRAAKRLKLSKNETVNLTDLKEKFVEMAKCHFLCSVDDKASDAERFLVPEIDLKHIQDNLDKCDDENSEFEMENKSDKMLWRVNYERFHREFRDQILVMAVTRRIDSSAGNLMRLLLNMMNESQPWANVSAHLRLNDIVDRLQASDPSSAIGQDKQLLEFHDQYVKVLEDDRTR